MKSNSSNAAQVRSFYSLVVDAKLHEQKKMIRRAPAGIVAFKKGILEYCGVKPVKVTSFGQVKNASEATRAQWLDQVKQLGRGVK